jgi:hypothetical protein
LAIGDETTFFVEPSYDSAGRTMLTATLRSIGTHSLVYVEDAYAASLSPSVRQTLFAAADALSLEFDTVIYPKLTAFYGMPWEPGIDQDPRITILLTKLIANAGGYVDTTDEYPRTQAPTSNEREMIYVNALAASSPRRLASYVAHEFTHLIDFNQKKRLRNVEDEVWLNELRAEYGVTVAGYDSPYAGSNLSMRASTFLGNPSDSLTEWKGVDADYGVANLFGQYLAGQYGGEVLAKTMQSSAIGIASLDAAFASLATPDRFADAFEHFLVASLIEDGGAGDRYIFAQPDLSSSVKLPIPTAAVSIGPTGTVTLTRSIEDWAGQWLRITPYGSGNETVTVTIVAQANARGVAVLTRLDGSHNVVPLSASSGGLSLTVSGILGYRELFIIPIVMGKTAGFSKGSSDGVYPDEPLRSYTMTIQRIASGTPFLFDAHPARILTFGGAMVTLKGSGLSGGTLSLTLDGIAIPLSVVDDATATFTAPAHKEGSVCVSITVNGKSSERCDLISYVSYPEGSLLRGESSPDVWVIKGRFRRHILSERIFTFYPHLSWASVIVVPDELVAQYRRSAWIRLPLTTDPMTWRVYEVNDDQTKHWITCADPDRCETTWRAHGGDPEGIYTVNEKELEWYLTGSNVFLR